MLPMEKFYELDFHGMEGIGDVLIELSPFKSAFPNLFKLIQISLTISVSTAQCERCFSALKRIKTYLHSTMNNERLANVAILSIESEIAKQISLEAVVDIFAAEDNNRKIVLK